MADTRELEKQLKLARKTGKYIVGRREVQSGLKGSKLLVWSTSANVPQKILDESRTLAVPAVKFEGNPVELGKACGIPFRVSVIAVKAPGDADLRAFSSASDYTTTQQVIVRPAAKEEAEEKKEPKKEAPKKSKKKEAAEPEEKEEPVEESTKAKKPAKKTAKKKSDEKS
jgi:large subunit ribosomal protein L30e